MSVSILRRLSSRSNGSARPSLENPLRSALESLEGRMVLSTASATALAPQVAVLVHHQPVTTMVDSPRLPHAAELAEVPIKAHDVHAAPAQQVGCRADPAIGALHKVGKATLSGEAPAAQPTSALKDGSKSIQPKGALVHTKLVKVAPAHDAARAPEARAIPASGVIASTTTGYMSNQSQLATQASASVTSDGRLTGWIQGWNYTAFSSANHYADITLIGFNGKPLHTGVFSFYVTSYGSFRPGPQWPFTYFNINLPYWLNQNAVWRVSINAHT